MQVENKNFITALVIIALLTGALAFFSACYFYSCEEKVKDEINQAQELIDTGEVEEVPTGMVKQEDQNKAVTSEISNTKQTQDDTYEFWTTYTSDIQGFSFMYPPLYVVSESKHYENPNMRTVSIIQTDKAGNLAPPPAMQIHVWKDAGIIQATLWEGIGFRHYENILHSFTFNSDKTSF